MKTKIRISAAGKNEKEKVSSKKQQNQEKGLIFEPIDVDSHFR